MSTKRGQKMRKAKSRGASPKAKSKTSATAFAPATVANVAVGFDILGFAVDAAGDRVTVSLGDEPGAVTIDRITGNSNIIDPTVVQKIPTDASKNTATVGLLKLLRDKNLPHGFRVSIEKGIPLGSGMGGSAASAVAAVVAANALLSKKLSNEELIAYALEGEAAASGSKHADNIAPCLLGGLVLSRSLDQFVEIPVPKNLFCVLVHPDLEVNTREARGLLKTEVTLKDHVLQSANLAGFLAGCFKSDTQLMADSLSDLIVEPQRAHLIQGFAPVKASALQAGALGCSISGSGPSVFALARGRATAKKVEQAMSTAFEAAGLHSLQSWVSPIRINGAELE